MSEIIARVWGDNYVDSIYLMETEKGLEVFCDEGTKEATVVLDERGIRNLRLALERYERSKR